MSERKCFRCFLPLKESEVLLHSKCSRLVFSQSTPPEIGFGLHEISQIALQNVNQSLSITGVQRKISANLDKLSSTKSRLTIVDGIPGYIVKTPSPDYPQIVENEALTMQLAREIGLNTAESTLLPLASGELALVVKRFDRQNTKKIAQEDFCQLLGQLTSEKYTGSIERVGKFLRQHSSMPGLDCCHLFDLVLFSFLSGNADMHLKNFSLFTKEKQIRLTPAYDLLNTNMIVPEDTEESALTINGKKRKLRRSDFESLGSSLGLSPKVISNLISAMSSHKEKFLKVIELSFLSDHLKDQYQRIVLDRFERML